MCTAITYKPNNLYFGRTLDYYFSFGEEVVITPRNYNLDLRHEASIPSHYALIGTAHVVDNYPLYYDAVNEKGLCIAALNFPDNAHYNKPQSDKTNISQFEFVPWLLGQCATVKETKEKLKNLNLVDTPFSEELPIATLHWIIADKMEAITVESVKEGLFIYDNPVGVMTNNPPFLYHMFNLNTHMGLSTDTPANTFSNKLDLKPYSLGMGGIGLPGDLSSASRFVKVAFTKLNALPTDNEADSVGQFFHILGSVEQQKGCCRVKDDNFEYTIYTSCCNADKGIYYYTTYTNRQITAVSLYNENLDGSELTRYPMLTSEEIKMQN